MGINAVGPQQGLLDQVLKGVEIAKTIYGIKQAGDVNDLAQQKLDFEKTKTPDPVKVETADAAGSPLTQFVTPKAGDSYKGYIKTPEAKETPLVAATTQGPNGPLTTLVKKVEGASWNPYVKPEKDKNDESYSKKDDAKIAGQLADKLNPNRRASGELGKLQGKINGAERGLGLALDKETGLPRRLTKGEFTELASQVGNVITNGGVVSQHVIDSMTPSSLSGDIAQQISYLSNNVDPAEMDSFVERLVGTLKREKEIAEKQKFEAQAQVLPEFNVWRNSSPERQKTWSGILRGARLDPNMFDEDSLLKEIQDNPVNPAKKLPKDTSDMAIGAEGRAPAAPPKGKVWVSNGKETREIDPADLQQAKASGYHQTSGASGSFK